MTRFFTSILFSLYCLGAVIWSFSVAVASPQPPTFSLPIKYKYNARIAEEGVTSTVEEVMNQVGTKYVKNTYTVDGSYTILLRNDLLGYYMYYPIEEQRVCYSAKLSRPQPISPPNFQGLSFSGQTLMNGNKTNIWRTTSGVYAVSLYTDAATGAIVGSDDHEFLQGDDSIFEFQSGPGFQPDDSVFDVPVACSLSHAEILDENSLEGLENSFLLSRISKSIQRRTMKQESSSSVAYPFHNLHLRSLSNAARAELARVQQQQQQHEKMISKTRTRSQILLSKIAHDIANPAHLLPPHPRSVPHPQQQQHREIAFSLSSNFYNYQIDNSNFASPVRNQGSQCGCCWSASTAAVAEIFVNRARGRNADNNGYSRLPRASTSLSFQSLVDCAHGDLNGTALIVAKGCLGGWPLTAMLWIAENGIPLEIDYPFDAANGAFCNLPSIPVANRYYPFKNAFLVARQTADDNSIVAKMEEALVKYGAFVVVINTPIDFLTYSQGIYDNPQCTPALNHAVVIVGVGTDGKTGAPFWKVKNSFGRAYGVENGYFRMAKGKNMCGIEDFAFVAIPSDST